MEYWLEWARGPAFIFAFCFYDPRPGAPPGLTLWEIYRAWRRAGDKALPIPPDLVRALLSGSSRLGKSPGILYSV